VTFLTDFSAVFDSRPRFCSTPSPNYVGEYSVHREGNAYTLKIDVKHPPSFVEFVNITYIAPIVILCVILSFLILTFACYRHKVEKVKNDLLVVSLGAIVFIPIYQLPLSSLKTPFHVTTYDYVILALFVLFALFVIVVVTNKIWGDLARALRSGRIETKQTLTKTSNSKSPKMKEKEGSKTLS